MLRPLHRATLLAVATSAIAACTQASPGTSTDGAPSPCDPLAPPPTTLSGILGVGKDGQGTLYVADEPPGLSEARVFVSSGNDLVRQQVIGSGQSGGGKGASAEYTLSFEAPASDGAAAEALLLDVQGGTASQMALGPPDSKAFLGDAGAGITPLTVVDVSAVAGMTIVNLPGVVAYVGDVSDGTAIVVTSPTDVSSSADFHLFYGTAGAMLERSIVTFSQALSGYPTITFLVGSTQYTMAISGTGAFDPDAGLLGGPGPGTLDTGSTTLPFTLRMPTPTTLGGFSFSCLGS
jgi:hypothetical protein